MTSKEFTHVVALLKLSEYSGVQLHLPIDVHLNSNNQLVANDNTYGCHFAVSASIEPSLQEIIRAYPLYMYGPCDHALAELATLTSKPESGVNVLCVCDDYRLMALSEGSVPVYVDTVTSYMYWLPVHMPELIEAINHIASTCSLNLASIMFDEL